MSGSDLAFVANETALADALQAHLEDTLHLKPSFARFEGIVVSGEHGLAKPDPELYGVLVRRFDVDPRTTVFVDDKDSNVEAAAALGFTGVVFTTPEVLRRDLARLGLPRP